MSGGQYPISGQGGYPITDLGGTPSQVRGYPIPCLGGYPIPDLARVPPDLGWGTPPARPGMGTPHSDLRWSTPLKVWTDTQSENITFPHPSDVGSKYITSERSTHIFPLCGSKQKIYVSHERFHSLENNAKKKFFSCLYIRWISMDLNRSFSSSCRAH